MIFIPEHLFIGGKKIIDFLAVKKYNDIAGKKEVSMPSKKMGRPISENPKSYRVDVRLTRDEMKILEDYCKRKGVTRPQGLRDGVKALEKK